MKILDILSSKGRWLVLLAGLLGYTMPACAQDHSVAREWSEVMLEAIRDDYARPTVHSRNLWHVSTVMYDAWAAFDEDAKPFFLGGSLDGYDVPFDGIVVPDDEAAILSQEEALSYAAYRLLSHRFSNSPGSEASQGRFDDLMEDLGYDMDFVSTDYSDGSPAALGNYIAMHMIEFGLDDGANEENNYENEYYLTINPWLIMDNFGNPDIQDPNRWQQLNITTFVDQAGNELSEIPDFLGPEWGNVVPFALTDLDKSFFYREGEQYIVYHDPGEPPYIDTTAQTGLEDLYKWNFLMTATWSSHLDPSDGVMIDIGPGAIGNIPSSSFPDTFDEYPAFYDWMEGGDIGQGWDENPATGQPYEPNVIPRGDYGRILAEFWADGPDSETPPGHWFTLLNYVSDQPDFSHQWEGTGEVLSNLEWDVKSYLIMGGAMHDCAVSAWGVKGWYDYIRPVSAIRYMAEKGQSSDPDGVNYHPAGMPIVPGRIEQVEAGDPLAGPNDEFVGEMKIKAWKGPDYIVDEEVDEAGVDWILAGNWWPYQRPTFVTPPFAGYVSGHSTFSRAAAEVMTLMTGDEFFPGGMGVFDAMQNEFLVFEEGPSVNCELQWATYRDASDQCSLSRIWGGIHPPADDIPGRKIGEIIGPNAFNFSMACMEAANPRVENISTDIDVVSDADNGMMMTMTIEYDKPMDTGSSPNVQFILNDVSASLQLNNIAWLNDTIVNIQYDVTDGNETALGIDVQVKDAADMDGNVQIIHVEDALFSVDNENPMGTASATDATMLSDSEVGSDVFHFTVTFSEAMNVDQVPTLSFPDEDASNSLSFNEGASSWMDDMNFIAAFDLNDANEDLTAVDLQISMAQDAVGNEQMMYVSVDQLDIDTKNPAIYLLSANTYVVDQGDIGTATFSLIAIFDENMDQDIDPTIDFPVEDPEANSLTYNGGESGWINSTTFVAKYDVEASEENLEDIDVEFLGLTDIVGNEQLEMVAADHFSINLMSVGVEEEAGNLPLLSVYPNPVRSNSEFQIFMDQLPQSLSLQIYTSNGRVVRQEQLNNLQGDKLTVSADGLAAGAYFVHLHSDAGQAVFQLQVVQ